MNRPKKEEGFLLPLLVIFLAVSVLIGHGMLSLGFNARIKALRHTEDLNAIAAAEAGITQGIYRMNEKLKAEPIWNNNTLGELAVTDAILPDSQATYSYKITGSPITGFLIESTGEYGIAERTFCATTMLRSIYEFSILVKRDLTLYPNTLVKGYNSATGASNLKTQIGTNSSGGDNVIVMNGATVDGDVYVGVDGNPDEVIKSKGLITGITDNLAQPALFPEVTPPTNLPLLGSIIGSGIISGPFGSGKYNEIRLGNNDILEISGPVVMHVTGKIVMMNGSEIRIKNNGISSLVMYLDGDWESKEGSGINNETSVPGNFILYGTGPEGQIIDLKAKNDFYGAVYAPNASMGIKAGGDIYGSFTGDNFEMKSKSTFHHDLDLANIDINTEGVFFRIHRWYEK